MRCRRIAALAVTAMLVVLGAGAQSVLGADVTPPWTSSLKTRDVVAPGTIWRVTVTPEADEVDFWASGKLIAKDTVAPFETPLNLPAGEHKIGFCHRKDGNQRCETTVPGTGIVALITIAAPAPAPESGTHAEDGNESKTTPDQTTTTPSESNGSGKTTTPEVSWSSSLKTGDLVPSGTVWKVSVTPQPDSVEFWASGKMIKADNAAPFETPLNLPAGEHKIGFCHRKDGVQTCETTEPGTGIVARIRIADATTPASDTTPRSSDDGSSSGGSTARGRDGDRSAPRPVRRIDVVSTSAEVINVQWPAARDNVLVAGYGIFLNDADVGATTRTSFSFTSLVCGTGYQVGVDAFDGAGNRSPKTSATVSTSACADRQAPTIPTSFTLAAATESTVVLTWKPSTDNIGVVAYGLYVAGLRVGTTSSPSATFSGLECGRTYRIGVDAADAAGNRSVLASASYSTTACADTQAPLRPAGLAASVTATDIVLTWSASSDNVGVSGYGVYKNGTRVATVGQTTATLSELTCGTTYALAVDATDPAGNRSARAELSVATQACPQPLPTDTWSSSLKTGDVVPSGTVWKVSVTPEPDSVEFWASGEMIKADTSAPFETPLNLPVGEHKIGFCDRKDGVQRCETTEPGTGIVARITVVSGSGTVQDIAPPSTPGNLRVVSASPTSVSLAWSASTDDRGVAGYGTYRNSTLVGTTTQTSTTVSGLTCGTAYDLGVDAYDAAGNRSGRARLTVTTSACADSQAPTVPSNVVVGARTPTSIALSWSTSTDNVGVVGYGSYRDGTLLSQGASTNSIVTGLACGRNYTLGVDAYDAAGNRSATAAVLVSTTACSDISPPTAPTGLAASNIAQMGMTLAWRASTDNTGVAGYRLYRDSTKVYEGTTLSWAETGLTCGTTYTYSVEAFDAAGNTSARNTLVTATTACATPTSGNVFMSPSGNDTTCARGNASLPCKTLGRAYAIAQSGDEISLADGSYAGGTLTGNKTVTFRVQAGGVANFTSRVVLNSLQNATIYGPFSTKPAYNSSEDIKDFAIDSCSNNLKLYDIHATLFGVYGSSDNITFYGGDFGGYSDSGQEDSWIGGSGNNDGCGGDGIVSNVVLDGIYLHDVLFVGSSQWGDSHPDCLQTGGLLDRLTIRNSVVARCGNAFFGFYGDFGNFTNIVIENNLFFGIRDSYWGFNIDPKNRSCSIIVRYNTYDPNNASSGGYAYSPPSILCQSREIYGNIFRRGQPGGCNQSGWSYNVFEEGDPCGSNYVVGNAGFVSRGSDYHLTAGSLALGKGDPGRFPSTDREGDPRSSPPDAGYDER